MDDKNATTASKDSIFVDSVRGVFSAAVAVYGLIAGVLYTVLI